LIGAGQVARAVGKLQRQVGVVCESVECGQRMVQEIERFKAELDILMLLEAEVLEKRKIAIEERRTFDIGPDCRTELAGRGSREAGRVKVLSRGEIFARIAGQNGH